jgi:hypothetical protein
MTFPTLQRARVGLLLEAVRPDLAAQLIAELVMDRGGAVRLVDGAGCTVKELGGEDPIAVRPAFPLDPARPGRPSED